MIDLSKLDDTLVNLRNELIALGVPHSVLHRVDTLHATLPTIEMYREKGKR